MIKSSLIIATLTFLAAPLSAFGEETSQDTIRLTVEDRVTGQIEPGLFGQFVELLSPGKPERGADAGMEAGTFRPDVRAALDQMHLPVLRYPGGGMVEAPGWRWTQLIDGAEAITGAAKDRRVNALGLHQFLDWATEVRAQPILVVKMADVARGIERPEDVIHQALAMLAYVNGRDDESCPADLRIWPRLRAANGRLEPWGVGDWQLGNEFTWVAVDHLRKKGLSRDEVADAYVEAVGLVHDVMRALDPDIRFLVEIDMEQDRTAILVADALHQRLKGDIAHMTAHKYLSWGIDRLEKGGKPMRVSDFDGEDFWYAAVSSPGTDTRGQAQFDIPMLHTANRLGYPLAITEWNWNSWWNLKDHDSATGPNQLWTKGVAAASFLHGLMNAPGHISLATQSMLIGTDWDIRAIDAATRPARLLPSGQITSLYGRQHGSERLAWTSASPIPTYDQPWQVGQLPPNPRVALLDCVVTRSKNFLFLHFINRQYESSLAIGVDTSQVIASDVNNGELFRLSSSKRSDSVSARQTETGVNREDGELWNFVLPARSVQVIRIPLDASFK